MVYIGMGGNVYTKEFSQGFVRTTNNRMELLAVIVGLETLKKQPLEVRGLFRFKICH